MTKQNIAECARARRRRRPAGIRWHRVIRNKIHFARNGAQKPRQVLRIRCPRIYTVDQTIFDSRAPAGDFCEFADAFCYLRQRPAPRKRDKKVADFLAAGVQRHREANLRMLLREPADAARDADCGNRDMPPAKAEALGVSEQLDRRQRFIIIEKRLSHTHEDRMANSLALRLP